MIFSIWEKKVRMYIPAARSIDTVVLRNALPKFLEDLVRTLASPEQFKSVEKHIGREHGIERSQLRNYDLNCVIEEYQILRRVLFDILRKSGDLSPADEDIILDAI